MSVYEGPEKPYQLDIRRIIQNNNTEEVLKAFEIKDPIVASAISSTKVNNNDIELKILSNIKK